MAGATAAVIAVVSADAADVPTGAPIAGIVGETVEVTAAEGVSSGAAAMVTAHTVGITEATHHLAGLS